LDLKIWVEISESYTGGGKRPIKQLPPLRSNSFKNSTETNQGRRENLRWRGRWWQLHIRLSCVQRHGRYAWDVFKYVSVKQP